MNGTPGQERTGPSSGSKSDDDEEHPDHALFQEPEGYFQSEKPPSFVEHTLLSGEELQLRLVGHSPLWVRGDTVSSGSLWLIGSPGSSTLERWTSSIRVPAAAC